MALEDGVLAGLDWPRAKRADSGLGYMAGMIWIGRERSERQILRVDWEYNKKIAICDEYSGDHHKKITFLAQYTKMDWGERSEPEIWIGPPSKCMYGLDWGASEASPKFGLAICWKIDQISGRYKNRLGYDGTV